MEFLVLRLTLGWAMLIADQQVANNISPKEAA